MEERTCLLQTSAIKLSDILEDIHSFRASWTSSSPFSGRSKPSGHPSGFHFHSASAIAGILGGNIPSAMDGMIAPSLRFRSSEDMPNSVPSLSDMLIQPDSVASPEPQCILWKRLAEVA